MLSKSNLTSNDKKARNKFKNALNKLSIPQLLFLINKYGLEKDVKLSGRIYNHNLTPILTDNLFDRDINDIIKEVDSVNDELNRFEEILNGFQTNQLRKLLAGVDTYSNSPSLLVNQVFLYIPFETIKIKLKGVKPRAKPKNTPKSENKTGIKQGKSVKGKPKSGISNKTEVKPKEGNKKVPTNKKRENKSSKEKEETKTKQDKPIKTEVKSNDKPDKVSIKKEQEDDSSELKSKLLHYDFDFLFYLLLNNKDSIDELKEFSESELFAQKDNLNIQKEKLVSTLIDRVSTEDIKEQCFNPTVYEFFPKTKTFKKPRDYQIETISQICYAIDNGYKYIVLEACSGFGKSVIAATLSRIYSKGKTHILTPTNQLLTPYYDEFKKFGLYKTQARSHFRCKNSGESCSPSKCLGNSCRYYRNSCEYFTNLREGLKSDTIVSTYKYFFLESFYQSDDFKHRKLLICDEGHDIDENVSKGVALDLYLSRLKNLNGLDLDSELDDLDETEDYYLFLLYLRNIYEESIPKLRVYRDIRLNSEIKKVYRKDLEKLNKFLSYFKRNDNNIAFKAGKQKWTFSPIKVKKFIPDVLGNYADVCLFMSSSIFDLENFAFDLGISEEEVYKIKVPPIFDSSDNPIEIYDLDMSYEELKNENAKKAIPIIKNILRKHKNEKGVIHTFSDECKNFLIDELRSTNRIFSYDGRDREEEINSFKESFSNKVLVSPSVDVGVDLPGDQCRFQIIFKLPYLPYEESRISKRKACYEDGKEWYTFKMLTRLIQAYGRGIRYEGDYCKTYILDGRLNGVIEEDAEGNQIIPQYFLDAIVDEKDDV